MIAAKPKWYEIAEGQIGTVEVPGPRSNPKVVQYYLDVVGKRLGDSVPWCAAFVGSCLMRGGEKSSGSLMARSYVNWGVKTTPKLGCVVVLSRGRPPAGHVAFYAGGRGSQVLLLGGNQGDAVNKKLFPKNRVIAYRWPKR